MLKNRLLATELAQMLTHDADLTTPIASLRLFRRSQVSVPMPCIYGLGLGVAVQGKKQVTLGQQVFDYAAGQALITAVDLPVVSHVTQASVAEPYLGLYVQFEARVLAQFASEMQLRPRKEANLRSMSVIDLDEPLLDALYRLVRLVQEPQLLAHLAPLIEQEIMLRLLNSPQGATLQYLSSLGSPSQQIAKVIAWLKLHFTDDLSVDELATKAHMSTSSFRQHFRAIAGMSPLQYIKNLRLQEARQLMLHENLDASGAAVRVGYESASQFSREYTRLFGAPPLRDLRTLRASA